MRLIKAIKDDISALAPWTLPMDTFDESNYPIILASEKLDPLEYPRICVEIRSGQGGIVSSIAICKELTPYSSDITLAFGPNQTSAIKAELARVSQLKTQYTMSNKSELTSRSNSRSHAKVGYMACIKKIFSSLFRLPPFHDRYQYPVELSRMRIRCGPRVVVFIVTCSPKFQPLINLVHLLEMDDATQPIQ